MCLPKFPAQISILAIGANCTMYMCASFKTSILDKLSLQVWHIANQPNSPPTYIHAFKPRFKHCLFLPNKWQTSFFDYFLCTRLSANFSRDQVILEETGRMIWHATIDGNQSWLWSWLCIQASNNFPNPLQQFTGGGGGWWWWWREGGDRWRGEEGGDANF